MRGVPNFYRVSDDLYRGDEPSPNGMKLLSNMGMRTVVCVRSWAIHGTEDRMKGLGMNYDTIPMVAWKPTDENIVQFLSIMANRNNRPVFIHCYTGGDRVGLLTAVYRVAFCGWPKSEAKAEMLEGGYGFHEILIKYLVTYFDELDIDALKARANVTESSITAADRAVSWSVIQSQKNSVAQKPQNTATPKPMDGQTSGLYNRGNEKEKPSATAGGAAGGIHLPLNDMAIPGRDLRREQRP
jgi:protein tyrosine/serine phosphatase